MLRRYTASRFTMAAVAVPLRPCSSAPPSPPPNKNSPNILTEEKGTPPTTAAAAAGVPPVDSSSSSDTSRSSGPTSSTENSSGSSPSETTTSPPPPPPPTPKRSPSSTIPKGFSRYFTKELLSRTVIPKNPTDGIANGRVMTEEELRLVNAIDLKDARYRQYRRLAGLGVLVTLFGGWRYSRHMALMHGDTSSYVSVLVDLPQHVAYFLDEKGKALAKRNFVDYRAFESTVDQVKDVMVHIYTYYPYVPMLLLLLLPIMSAMNSGFNNSAKEAARIAAKGGSDKKRFNFKREVGIQTRLPDVAGLTEAKHEVVEVIDFLKHPERYRKLGARLPKGVLLDGPPGVGKTLLAKAVAGEAMVPFVSCSGSEFEEVFVGVGAQRVRELFKEAHKSKPCVVFIDEIDAFGKKRKTDGGGGGSRSTLNAFLAELDGFYDASGIIVLAATNRADVLDPALTRSGRFDRKISLELPPHKDRVAIAKVHLAPLKLDPAVSLDMFAETIASLTTGCSGADIYNICNEAAIISSRESRDYVNVAAFHKALERVLLGMEKKAVTLSSNERERIAYHQAGIVVLNWFLKTTDPVVKTTIAPRGANTTGLTQKLPQSVYISTQERIREAMIARLGGFVTEEYFFKDLSTSAAEDLKRVTDMARDEVCRYGMDPHTIGHVGYQLDDENALQKPFGPKKENAIDESIAKIVEDCAEKARKMLHDHLLQVRSVAGLLLKNETLTAQELWVVLGDRPEMSQEFRKYLQS